MLSGRSRFLPLSNNCLPYRAKRHLLREDGGAFNGGTLFISLLIVIAGFAIAVLSAALSRAIGKLAGEHIQDVFIDCCLPWYNSQKQGMQVTT